MKTTIKTTAKDLLKSAINILDALSQHPEISDSAAVENAMNLILELRNQCRYE